MDAFLKKHKITVFDLEGYEETVIFPAKIWEYSFHRSWLNEPPILVSVGHENDIPDDLLKPLIEALRSSDIIVGHNIECHDLEILRSKGFQIPSRSKIWDTLKFELLLANHTERHSFALKTPHQANQDVLVTTDLFKAQITWILKHRDEYDSYKNVLPKRTKVFLDSAFRELSDNAAYPTMETSKFFYDEVFPLSNYFSGENLYKFNNLKNNSKVLIVAPHYLWDAIFQAIRPEIRNRVLFYTKDPNFEHKVLRLKNDKSFFKLDDPWYKRVVKRYYDYTQSVFVFQLPNLIQDHIKRGKLKLGNTLDCRLNKSTIICIRPIDRYLINRLPQIEKAIVVGGNSLLVSDDDYNYVKSAIHNCTYVKICFKKPSSYKKTRVLPNRTSYIGVNWDNFTQINIDYTPIIVVNDFKDKDKDNQYIIDKCVTEIKGRFPKKERYDNSIDSSSVRRIELARKNNGFAFLEMREFLSLNKVIKGNYVIIFDNLVSNDIDIIERNISIVLHLAAQFFNHPRVIINDRYYNHYMCSDPIVQFNC